MKCKKELEFWQAAEESLNAVLAADAVPTKPLDEFVAACTVHTERLNRWAAFIEWLSAPRRAVAATVAGSFAMTVMLVLIVWFGSMSSPSTDHGYTLVPQIQYQVVLGDNDQLGKGEMYNGF